MSQLLSGTGNSTYEDQDINQETGVRYLNQVRVYRYPEDDDNAGNMTEMKEDTGITVPEVTGGPGRCPVPVVTDNDVRNTDETVLPSVEEHQNSCPGKNKHQLLTNITCIATPGDPDVYATPVVTTTTSP